MDRARSRPKGEDFSSSMPFTFCSPFIRLLLFVLAIFPFTGLFSPQQSLSAEPRSLCQACYLFFILHSSFVIMFSAYVYTLASLIGWNAVSAQYLPDAKANTVRELEHIYLDASPNGLINGVTPCSTYIDPSTGQNDGTKGRQTASEWIRVAFRRSNSYRHSATFSTSFRISPCTEAISLGTFSACHAASIKRPPRDNFHRETMRSLMNFR